MTMGESHGFMKGVTSSDEEARRVLALKAPGVFAQREYRRYYPAGEVAGHVVGFTNIDGLFITAGEPRSDARAFIDFVLSPRGQAIVQKHGFLPVAEAKAAPAR